MKKKEKEVMIIKKGVDPRKRLKAILKKRDKEIQVLNRDLESCFVVFKDKNS